MIYKLIAYVDLLLGIFQILMGGSIIFVVIPKMTRLYNEFNAEISPLQTYLGPIMVILLGMVNIFLFFKIIKTEGRIKEKYFTIGAIYFAISLLLTFFLNGLSIMSEVNPIYSLTSM